MEPRGMERGRMERGRMERGVVLPRGASRRSPRVPAAEDCPPAGRASAVARGTVAEHRPTWAEIAQVLRERAWLPELGGRLPEECEEW